MIATWMLYGTVVGVLAGIGALTLERGLRLIGRAGRWAWVGAMAITVALPVVAWLRPQVLQPAGLPSPATFLHSVSLAASQGLSGIPLDRPLAIGWLLASCALAGWLWLSHLRLSRMRPSWRPQGGIWVSEDVGPAVVGFVRCQVVVPEWSLELSAEQRDLLMAHEQEHLAARDPRLLLLATAALTAMPWNAALWWYLRRLRLAVELDCDQRVLRGRPDRASYGRLLLDVGARATSLVPALAFHEPSSLETRIRSMTATRPKGAMLRMAGLAVAAGVAVFAACETPQPTGPTSSAAPDIVLREDPRPGDVRVALTLDSIVSDQVNQYVTVRGRPLNSPAMLDTVEYRVSVTPDRETPGTPTTRVPLRIQYTRADTTR